MQTVIYGMIYAGVLLMVYNIYGFGRFAAQKRELVKEKHEFLYLYVPVVLLTLFLLGYLGVGLFGEPDLIIAGILFGGSVFVFVMYRLLARITERIAEHEHLESALLVAEESNRAKTTFLSDVSHEMRTPMNVIIGLDNLVLNDASLSPDTRDKVEKIGYSAKHLLGLINNILDMNSIETGEFSVKSDPFPLREVIGQISAIAETQCESKGLAFSLDFAEDADVVCTGDEMRLKQVLLSILDNAVKYTDVPGKVGLSVKGEDLPDGRKNLIFTVKDTGVGIDAAFLPHLFEPFAKEDAGAASGNGGSGVGLAVTGKIAERLGGKIGVESEKGVGSTFTVTLPFEVVKNETDGGEEAEASLQGRHILIAEDIPENAEIVMDLLELEGAESDHAENGKIAVEMFRASADGYYDAILMDLRMPVMDGLAATREIRASARADAARIPILALTANAFETDIRESLSAGMNAHLAKPADADMLYGTLKKHIALYRGMKEADR